MNNKNFTLWSWAQLGILFHSLVLCPSCQVKHKGVSKNNLLARITGTIRLWDWICQQSRKWHWVVTLAVASPYQGVKLGPGSDLGNQSWLWETTAKGGVSTLALKPTSRGNRSLKKRDQWFHKMVTCHHKVFLLILPYHYIPISPFWKSKAGV